MKSFAATEETRLTGDWTISGVVLQAETLMNYSSHHDLSEPVRTLVLDCSGIERIDMTGLQLLYVWMQCVKLRGIKPGLINIPDEIRESIKHLGFNSVILDNTHIPSQKNMANGDCYEC